MVTSGTAAVRRATRSAGRTATRTAVGWGEVSGISRTAAATGDDHAIRQTKGTVAHIGRAAATTCEITAPAAAVETAGWRHARAADMHLDR